MGIFRSSRLRILSENMSCLSIRMLWMATAALVFLTRSSAAPAIDGTNTAMMYLAQYGYLSPALRNPSNGHLLDERSWREAVAEFQSFAGLDVTGELDEKTAKYMSLPRCGVRDKVNSADKKAKRYALQGSRWQVKNLTYKISKYPTMLKRADVDKEIVKAFAMLSNYTNLSFSQKRSGQVHIDIRFEKGEHGDDDPFDGAGGTLAHAYFPVYGSNAHFDDDETWTIDSETGTNLLQVAAHEFGHSLGLSHSNVRSALMAPFSKSYDPTFQLDHDDIQGIQALYGHKTQTDVGSRDSVPIPSVTTTTTTPQPAPKVPTVAESPFCRDPKIDTIFTSADGGTIVFKGEQYWRLTEDSGGPTTVAAGYPQPIGRAWPGLPGNIDAAFTYKNGKTYFFKGSKYWRYDGQTMDGYYPREISEGFIGIPDNINAALVWSGDGKIYFFKGSKFWRYEPTQQALFMATYPKPLSNWKGIPDNIDAALHYNNGITYFFKGGSYWRFDDTTFSVYVDPKYVSYPYSTAFWWLGCSSAPRGTMPPEQSGRRPGTGKPQRVVMN